MTSEKVMPVQFVPPSVKAPEEYVSIEFDLSPLIKSTPVGAFIVTEPVEEPIIVVVHPSVPIFTLFDVIVVVPVFKVKVLLQFIPILVAEEIEFVLIPPLKVSIAVDKVLSEKVLIKYLESASD